MILAEIKLSKDKRIRKFSYVRVPAVEVDWLTMSMAEIELAMSIDEELHQVTGPILTSDRRYPRSRKFFGGDEDGYIFFSKDTVKEIAQDLINPEFVSLEHDDDDIINKDDFCILESWLITTENDKAYDLKFTKEQCPIVTIMQTHKINVETTGGKQLWKDIKAGIYRGFSVQGNPVINIIAKGLAMSEDSDFIPEHVQPLMLARLKEVGQTIEQLQSEGYEMVTDEVKMAIESDPNAESSLDNDRRLVRYYYKGVRDDKNRKFCADLLDMNLWFRKEDINQMSFRAENGEDFGTYSIFKFEGSYGCRHTWDKNYFSPSMKFSKEELLEQRILSAFDDVLREYRDELKLGAPEGNDNAAKGHTGFFGKIFGGGNNKVEVSNATTIAEANQYAEKNMGIKASYGSLSVETANNINNNVAETMKDFPALKNSLTTIDDKPGAGYNGAYRPDENRLSISPRADINKMVAYKDGTFLPAGCGNEKYLISHELGHSIEYGYKLRDNKEIHSTWNSYKMYPGFRAKLTKDLSIYACTNEHEFIAEAWAEYKSSAKPRPLAMKIGKSIEKYKGKK